MSLGLVLDPLVGKSPSLYKYNSVLEPRDFICLGEISFYSNPK